MTSEGHPYARFRRALERGNIIEAESAVRELHIVNLADALEYVDLLARRDRRRFERAAIRWHAKLAREHPSLTFAQSHLVLAALQQLPGDDRGTALAVLRHLVKKARS